MKCLIVKTSALGDIIHVFPVIDYLKQKFPHAQIDWVVEEPFSGLVKAHPDITRTICVNTKKWRKTPLSRATWREIGDVRKQLQQVDYDYVFDLQGNIKSGLLTLQAKSPVKVGFGRQTVPEWPNTLVTNRRFNPPAGQNIRNDYLYLVQSTFQDCEPISFRNVVLQISEKDSAAIHKLLNTPILQHRSKIMVCPGSAWRNKQMDETALADFLKSIQKSSNCHFLLAWGTPEERLIGEGLQKQLPEHAQVIERLSLPALQNLMGHMDLVIAMDSLPLHLAGTTATQTFSIFGPSLAAKYKPEGPRHHTFQGTCPYGRSFEKRCPILRTCKTGACIRNLDADALLAAFNKTKVLNK